MARPAADNRLRGIGFALSAASFYGLVPNLARTAYVNGIPALETVLYRTIAVAVVLSLAAVALGFRLAVPRAAWPSFGWQVLATFAVSACYLASVQYIPVGLAVLIFFTFPVIILLLAPLLEGHAPSLPRIAVALLAFAGLAVAIGGFTGPAQPLGLVLAGLAAAGCALQFFSGRALAQHMHPTVFGGLVHVAILPVVLALVLGVRGGIALPGMATLPTVDSVAGVCASYLAGYLLHMSSVRAAPASVVAPFFNFEPVVTTVIAVLLLGESFTLRHALGAGLVGAALVGASLLRDDRR